MKKFLIICLVVALIFEALPCYIVSAEIKDSTNESLVIVDQENNIDDIDSSVETVILDDMEINDINSDELGELLDDGVCIFDMNTSGETIEECFEEYDLDVDDSPNVLGYQISKKDSNIYVNTVTAEIVSKEGEKNQFDDEECKKLVESIELENKDYIELTELNEESVINSEITDEQKAFLQSDSVADEYAYAKRTTYFYRFSTMSPTGVATKKGTDVQWYYKKIGYTTLTLYAIKAGGRGDRRFDAFYTIALVGGSGGFSLLNFTVQNRLYDEHDCEIIDVSHLKGGDEKKSVTLGLGLGASGKGLSPNFSAGFSYSYNPSGYKISNTTNDGNEMQPNWVCSKSFFDAKANGRAKITPMIIVDSPKGKKKITKVSARVKLLRFKCINSYAIKNNSGNEYVYLKVKNHKEV